MVTSIDGARRPQKGLRPKTQQEQTGIRPEDFFIRNRVRSAILIREASSPEDQNHVNS